MFIFALLIIVASTFNLLVIPRLPDISEASKVFYNGLSISDLIFGIILLSALPSSIVGDWPFGDAVCKIFGFGITLITGFSAGSLLLLNLDRFFTVVSPFRYTVFMNQRKAIAISIAFCVVESAAFVAAIFMNPLGWEILNYSNVGVCIIIFSEPEFLHYSITIFAIFIWLFIPLLSIIYTRIICISRRHARQIQALEVSMATQARNVSQIDDGPCIADVMNVERSVGKPRAIGHRALKMTLLVTGSFVVTWIPFTVCQVYIALNYPVSMIIRVLVTWPVLLTPLCNVVIYSAMKKSYRIEATKLLARFRTCSLADPRNHPRQPLDVIG